MAEMSHDFNFLNETLLALFFRVSGFFGKGLNSVSVFILMFFDKINRGEVSFSNFIKSLELLMKSSLVKFEFEDHSPSLKILVVGKLVSELCVTFFEEDFSGVLLESEFEIKIEDHSLLGSFVVKSIFVDFDFGFSSFS
jgi:hypothetical protein